MASGRTHFWVAVAAAAAMIHQEHLDPSSAEVAAALLAGSWAPDLDNARSTAGRLVPEAIAPSADHGYWYGRNWFHLIRIRHRGPFHSLPVGMGLAFGLGRWAGWLVGLAFGLGWVLHLLFDPGRKQLFWPLSSRWLG